MMDNYQYMVCTRCSTYNHAQFVESALDGFAMQKTGFPIVFTVVDDFSSDGEQDVIRHWANRNLDFYEDGYAYQVKRDYGEILFARHKNNTNATFVLLLLSENHTQTNRGYLKLHYIKEWEQSSKYVAICEGDDFWTDSYKLQKQVEFLESHPSHSACIHAYRRVYYTNNGVLSKDVHKYDGDVDVIPDEDVICNKGLFCATASWVFRASAVENYPEWTKHAIVGDKPLKLVLFSKGSIAYIDELMSVYRVGVPGSWTSRVLRAPKEEKKSRKGLVKLSEDFDQWTKGKYHKLVLRQIREYKLRCIKNDIYQFIRNLITILMTLFK